MIYQEVAVAIYQTRCIGVLLQRIDLQFQGYTMELIHENQSTVREQGNKILLGLNRWRKRKKKLMQIQKCCKLIRARQMLLQITSFFLHSSHSLSLSVYAMWKPKNVNGFWLLAYNRFSTRCVDCEPRYNSMSTPLAIFLRFDKPFSIRNSAPNRGNHECLLTHTF